MLDLQQCLCSETDISIKLQREELFQYTVPTNKRLERASKCNVCQPLLDTGLRSTVLEASPISRGSGSHKKQRKCVLLVCFLDIHKFATVPVARKKPEIEAPLQQAFQIKPWKRKPKQSRVPWCYHSNRTIRKISDRPNALTSQLTPYTWYQSRCLLRHGNQSYCMCSSQMGTDHIEAYSDQSHKIYSYNNDAVSTILLCMVVWVFKKQKLYIIYKQLYD